MTSKTLEQIKEKIKDSPNIPEKNKAEYVSLLAELSAEIEELKETDQEKVESIKAFTKISAHEATRKEIDANLMKISIDGLSESVKEFEISYPRLVSVVNSICDFLSKLGI